VLLFKVSGSKDFQISENQIFEVFKFLGVLELQCFRFLRSQGLSNGIFRDQGFGVQTILNS
jgi:hypothetical protein